MFAIKRLADPVGDGYQHPFMAAKYGRNSGDTARSLPVEATARVVTTAADRALPAGLFLILRLVAEPISLQNVNA